MLAYYAGLAGRSDLIFLSLSDKKSMAEIKEGDFVVVARGRRYFSNDRIVSQLKSTGMPVASVSLGGVPAIEIYALDGAAFAAISTFIR